MPAILEVEHLVKKYGEFAAVNDISFRTYPKTPETESEGKAEC